MQIITTLRSRVLSLITKLPPLFFSLLHRWLANCYLLVFLTLQFASHLHKKLKAEVEAFNIRGGSRLLQFQNVCNTSFTT